MNRQDAKSAKGRRGKTDVNGIYLLLIVSSSLGALGVLAVH
jgi:hypothetical protein